MKVLLVNPPLTQYARPVEIQADEPLGLMYLASYLRQRNIDVEIFDAFRGLPSILVEDKYFRSGLSEEQIRRKISDYQPDLLGITSMFTMHSRGAHEVARIAKEVSRSLPVVFGGSHASAMAELVLRDKNIDTVVIGEGEETLYALVSEQAAKRTLKGVAGTAWSEDSAIKWGAVRSFIKDLDSLPLPARDLVDMRLYLGDTYRNAFSMSPPRANVVTSRGCPFRCPFCSVHSIWKHSWRGFSPKRVGDELELLVKDYGIREVAFQDDNLTVDRKRIDAICEQILSRGLKLKWCTPNGVAIWTLDRELIRKMKRSGCYKLTFGIETGSVRTQEFIHKRQIDFKKSNEIIKFCNKIGMWTHASFIIGFPFEEANDIEETLKYSLDSDLDFAGFFVATPFPGTELYDLYMKEELLSIDLTDPVNIQWEGCQQFSMCDTRYFSKEEIAEFVREANRAFYRSRIYKFLNPLRLIRKLNGFNEIKYFLRLVQMYGPTMKTMSK